MLRTNLPRLRYSLSADKSGRCQNWYRLRRGHGMPCPTCPIEVEMREYPTLCIIGKAFRRQ